MPDPKKSPEHSPGEGTPESHLLAAVKSAVTRERTVKEQFGPFEVGDVVQVDKYDLTVTVTSCNDPKKTYQVGVKDYIKWTK